MTPDIPALRAALAACKVRPWFLNDQWVQTKDDYHQWIYGADGDGVCEVHGNIAMGVHTTDRARLIALAVNALPSLLARIEKLERVAEAAKRARVVFRFRSDDVIEHFERGARQFHSETGMLRPGKDASLADVSDYDTRRDAWDSWVQSVGDSLDAALADLDGGNG